MQDLADYLSDLWEEMRMHKPHPDEYKFDFVDDNIQVDFWDREIKDV